MDSEYDIFSYYFGSSSGKFIFKDNNNVKTPVLLPYKPYQVIPHYTNQGLTGIDITDDKGTLYQFNNPEGYLNQNGAKTAFAITKIISADKTDTISFIYTTINEDRSTASEQITLNDQVTIDTASLNIPVINDQQITSHAIYYVQRLTEIDFKQGKVLFTLGTGFDDITTIKIININNETVKIIQLNKATLDHITNFGYSTRSLSNLIFKDPTGNTTQKYAFDYYPTVASTNIDVRRRDWWGYFNDAGSLNLIPRYTVPYDGSQYTVGNTNANREPALSALEAGILKKIIYPTGGSTEFIYENNKYYSNKIHQVKNGPGLRIAQINSADNNGLTTTRTYRYGISSLGESGYGILDMEPDISNMSEEYDYIYYPTTAGSYPDVSGSYRQRIFYSDFISSLSAISDRPIVYTEVTEYRGTPDNNIGKVIYTYDYSGWAPGEMLVQGQVLPVNHIYNCNYWDNPQLIQKTVYKRVPGGISFIYQPVNKTVNNFHNTTLETINGLHARHLCIFPQDGIPRGASVNPDGLACEPFGITVKGVEAYTYGSYQIVAGYKNLMSTSDTVFNDDGSRIVNNTSYTYNSRQFVNKITKVQSDGTNHITKLTYPFDYPGNSTLTQMTNNNLLNNVIEQTNFKNTTLLTGVKTNYYNWGTANPMFAPQTIAEKKGAGSYETRLHYFAYDGSGHPINVSKQNDERLSYIWDYKNSLPIAKVQNATISEIAFTSFEAEGSGNWSGINASNKVSSAGSLTGMKYYTFNGSTLSKSGLTSSKSYTVSYWSRNGAYTVNGTTSGWPKNIRTAMINGITWTYWEHHITGITTATISGSGSIDELRLYPADAQMASYTYKPLVGMISEDNESGQISYYEYDGLGRLQDIKDQNGNIIKTLKYHTVQ